MSRQGRVPKDVWDHDLSENTAWIDVFWADAAPDVRMAHGIHDDSSELHTLRKMQQVQKASRTVESSLRGSLGSRTSTGLYMASRTLAVPKTKFEARLGQHTCFPGLCADEELRAHYGASIDRVKPYFEAWTYPLQQQVVVLGPAVVGNTMCSSHRCKL